MNRLLSFFKKLLPQNAFARGVGVLVSGTAGAQVLMVLATPLLTRFYTPEDFGLLAVYSGLLALFSVIASLRYELAIPLPESNTEAGNVIILCLIMVLAMSIISGLMVQLAGDKIALALDLPVLAKYFWLLPIGVLLSGTYKVFNYWAVRTKAFGAIAKTRLNQTLITLTIQILGFKLGGITLLFGQTGGQGVGSFRLAKSALKNNELRHWSWLGVWGAAKRYRQFPMFSTWSALFNTAGSQLPPLMLAAFFTAGGAGLYALAHRILNLPMTLLGRAIGQVYYSSLAASHREAKLAEVVEQGFSALLKISLPAAALFMVFAPEFFSFVFGADWKVSGQIALWMTPWLVFQFISSPLSTVYFVLEKEKIGLYFQVVMFAFRVAAVFMGYIYFDFMQAIIIYSTVSAICYAAYTLNVLIISKVSVSKFIHNFFKELLLVSIGIIPVLYFHIKNHLIGAIICALIMLFIFYTPRIKAIYS